MEEQHNGPKVLIRKYRYGDEKAIIRLVNEGTMVTVNPFFLRAATREVIAQVILMFAAILFIVVGTSLKYSLLAIPITLVTLYIGIYVGHWGKANKTHTDLLDIPQKYLEREKCGFWVAILLDGNNPSPPSTSSSSSSSSSNIKHYAFVSEDKDANENDIENSLFPSNENLIGTLAIDIKQDPDMKEPPESVALLKRMAVSKKHQRRGIASAMMDIALDHCRSFKYRAIELITTEHHEAARNLYARKGFELIASFEKNFVFGLVSITLYRLRRSCSLLLSNNWTEEENGIEDTSNGVNHCHENIDPAQ